MPPPPAARDAVYCHLVGRRAAARAALALGLAAASEEALDALAAVLVAYLERVGRALCDAVQATGRTSAHANVLDALAAAEACAAPAVRRLRTAPDGRAALDGLGAPLFGAAQDEASWKGLAAFCFGPDWAAAAPPDGAASGGSGSGSGPGRTRSRSFSGAGGAGGGKAAPSAASIAASASRDAATSATAAFGGWDAPYPDEVPPFPRVLGARPVANPHALPERIGRSLQEPRPRPRAGEKDDAAPEALASELDRMPDALFTDDWGALERCAGRRGADDMDVDDEPPAPKPAHKKARIEVAAAASEVTAPSEDRLHVPFFFPDFPQPTITLVRTVVERAEDRRKAALLAAQSATASVATQSPELDPTLKVRSTLVSLDRSAYWGSAWEEVPAATPDATVPPGRPEPAASGGATALIVPLGRASGSRVSRILEGSMEPPAAA